MARSAADLSHWEEEIPASALSSPWYETFSEWFAAFLSWSGMTKKKTAERLGVSAENVSRVSKRSMCPPSFAAKIAEVFGPEGVEVPARLVSEEQRGRR